MENAAGPSDADLSAALQKVLAASLAKKSSDPPAPTIRQLLQQQSPSPAVLHKLRGKLQGDANPNRPVAVTEVLYLATSAALVSRCSERIDDPALEDRLRTALAWTWIDRDVRQLLDEGLATFAAAPVDQPPVSVKAILSEMESAGVGAKKPKPPGRLTVWLGSPKVRLTALGGLFALMLIPLACQLMPKPPLAEDYEGLHEVGQGPVIIGWVWDRARPDVAIMIEIDDGKNPKVRMLADLYRDDLFKQGKGDGRHGFLYEIPAVQRDGQRREVWVRIADTRRILDETPRTITYSR